MSAYNTLKAFYDGIKPILDIGILTFIFYYAYQMLVKTKAMQILTAGIVIAVSFGLAAFLNLPVLLWILRFFAPGLAICFAIVFQPEIRNVFLKLGQKNFINRIGNTSKTKLDDITKVITAAELLSQMKKGMLIVFPRTTKIDDIIDSGTRINADLSPALLLTIFKFETELHDAACIVRGGKLIAAGCFLPLSQNYDIKKTFGTRHRAALGLSEQTDAVVLVVSEETGAISLAYDGKLEYDLKSAQITKILTKLLNITSENKTVEVKDAEN